MSFFSVSALAFFGGRQRRKGDVLIGQSWNRIKSI